MRHEQATDAEVIATSRERPQEFAVLYDRHAAAVSRYLASRIGQGPSAEDLLHDTFLTALELRDGYDPSYPSALPWLLGISTRLIKKHRRLEHKALRITSTEADLAGEGSARMVVDPTAEIESRLDAAVATSHLRVALTKLKPRDRDVLHLYAFTDLDLVGIAEVLAVPVGTVRSRLHRIRKTLKTHLGATYLAEKEHTHG
ncbi:RNA polymerase sigma factor [Leucobacter sp. wl10]|uniref:RNA polymerase sigma factor n=1 Tax=Leucobacter sp. wl10 TaxID=2304677 RepID=UPI000E5AB61A|nr:sigma-70 family RNA polymerase sigma factor [Leucobacter sp. wl10]RGE18038.1 sigma-70 family RNA polymerase sigma factor [Leucobacter sp. wl10]